ncbi:MAG: exodeoxyribonuclease VII large subunit, partial [Comamonas sp.]
LVAQPRQLWLDALDGWQQRIVQSLERQWDRHAQRLDTAAQRLSRPSQQLSQHRLHVAQLGQRCQHALQLQLQRRRQHFDHLGQALGSQTQRQLERQRQRLQELTMRMELLSPQRVLERGYSVLTTAQGQVVSLVKQAPVGTPLKAVLADGTLDITVTQPKLL